MKIKHLLLLSTIVLSGIWFTACSDDEVKASDLEGDYRCNVVAYTTYRDQGGALRDTTYHGSKSTVRIERVDDKTVSLSITVGQWSWTTATASNIAIRDAGTGQLVNLSGEGEINRSGVSTAYPASVSGTFSADSKSLALSLQVKNYSQRFVLSLTTR